MKGLNKANEARRAARSERAKRRMEKRKRILCRECGGTIEVIGDVDETYGPDEVAKVTCPFCSKVNEVMWPRSAGWCVFVVFPVKAGKMKGLNKANEARRVARKARPVIGVTKKISDKRRKPPKHRKPLREED